MFRGPEWRRALSAALGALLSDVAVAGTALETGDCYPDDTALRATLAEMVAAATAHLLKTLAGYADQLQRGDSPFDPDTLRAFQGSFLCLGDDRGARSLAEVTRCRDPDGSADAPAPLGELPPREFMRRVLEAFSVLAGRADSYADQGAYRAAVCDSLEALLIAAERA